jgi:hypothetical protein
LNVQTDSAAVTIRNSEFIMDMELPQSAAGCMQKAPGGGDMACSKLNP